MPRFCLVGNSTVWGKYETCHFYPRCVPFLTQFVGGKNGTSVKAVFLISTSHGPKPFSVP